MQLKIQKFQNYADLSDFEKLLHEVFCISYVSILFKFVLWMLEEKQKHLKDLFIRQGISTIEYFISWLMTFLIMTLPMIVLNSVLLKLYFFNNSNFFLIFLNLFLFSINILSMALVFHQFAKDIRTGQSLLKFLYMGVSILSVPLSKEGTPIVFRIIFSIFPQTLLRNSFEIFFNTRVKLFFNFLIFYFLEL